METQLSLIHLSLYITVLKLIIFNAMIWVMVWNVPKQTK